MVAKELRRDKLSVEMILRRSFWDSCVDYGNNCSLAGTKLVGASSGLGLAQRMLWAVMLATAIATILYYLYYMWTDTLSKPLIVTLESTEYPIEYINFPAVAICNVNRISKKALVKLAAEEFKDLAKGETREQIEKALLNFGRLIDYSYNESLLHDKLYRMMVEKYRLESKEIMPIMKKLSPDCNEMLIRCGWGGDMVDCSSIFTMRRTANRGFCCTFNYLLNHNSAIRPLTADTSGVQRQITPGLLHGLLVVFDPMVEDYAYPLRKIEGFDVLLFDSMHFADPHAGRVIHRVAEANSALFMEIHSTEQIATTEIRKYNLKTRKCLFRDELTNHFFGMYSYSTCLVACKILTIVSLCKCIPFFYATNKNFRTDPICTFEDLKCLNKYKEKLFYIYPYEAQDYTGLEMELEDSVNCQECRPDCELIQYSAKTFSSPIDYDTAHTKAMMSRIISNNGYPTGLDLFSFETDGNYKADNVSEDAIFFSGSSYGTGINTTGKGVLSVYNPTHDATLIRLDVVFYWYEILSNFGGFCGIMVGFSIISIVEVIYFFTIRYIQHFIKNYKKYH